MTTSALPLELAASNTPWFSRACNYAIFSAEWFRYRSRAMLTCCTLVIGIIVVFLGATFGLNNATIDWPLLALMFGIHLTGASILVLLGPSLALVIRRRAWTARRETSAILAALLFGMACGIGVWIALKSWYEWPVANLAGDRMVIRSLPKLIYNIGVQQERTDIVIQQASDHPSGTPMSLPLPSLAPHANISHQRLPPGSLWPSGPTIDDAAFAVLMIAMLSLLCWLGGLFDLRAFVRQRGKLDDALTRQALARARDERNTAELKLSVLAAQVEPHFLFNTLASVRAAIASDPSRAAHIVDHMVDYLRATIPQMRGDAARTTVALGAQLAAARSYLALMHERIPRLQFTVEAEPGLERAAMPPLMLISLVENAVKHGVEPKVGPATVNVRARRHEDALEVSVTDDGVGFGDTSSGAGIGLSNIQERLRTLFGQHASLSLRTCPDGGVAAILRLPLSIEP